MSWQQHPWQKYKWQKHPWQQFEGQEQPWQKYTWQKHPWQEHPWQQHPWQQYPWQKYPWQTFEGQQYSWQQQPQLVQDSGNSKIKTNTKNAINLQGTTQGVNGIMNMQQNPINLQGITQGVNGITNITSATNNLPENTKQQKIVHLEENDTIETITQLCSQIDELTKKTENRNDNQNGSIKNDCAICLNEKVNVVFIPCGHAASCDQCAALLTTCCICRAPITTCQKVFF